MYKGVKTYPRGNLCLFKCVFISIFTKLSCNFSGWILAAMLFTLSLGDTYAFGYACLSPYAEQPPMNQYQILFWIIHLVIHSAILVLYIAIILKVINAPLNNYSVWNLYKL